MAQTVFVSSTYTDLIEHRAAVSQALLNAGFHPVDMVHFMARPVDATAACLKEVADSDLFVGIYAWRYGYIPGNDDFGITEQEFLEARRLKKPCFCFVIDENHPWPDKKRDTGINKRLLSEFKTRLEKILVHAIFTTPEDLALKVLASLQRWKTEEKNEKSKHKTERFSLKSRSDITRRQNELILLERVRHAWIDGVLKHSLHNEVIIELGKEKKPDSVETFQNPFHIKIKTGDSGSRILTPDETIIEIYDKSEQSLLILGSPGSGKTVTLLDLARHLADRAESDPLQPVPIVLNLSSWTNKNHRIKDWLSGELFKIYRIPRKVGKKWVEDAEGHPLIFLLDGLDEVNPALQTACVSAINIFREEYGFSGIVIACRDQDYREIAVKLKLEMAVQVQELTLEQVDTYLSKAGQGLEALKSALQNDRELQELARSPLMLNIMALAYKNAHDNQLKSDQAQSSEMRCQKLFAAYLNQMFIRKKYDQKYSESKKMNYLIWLARQMVQHNQSLFLIENMQASWLPNRMERWLYVFLSRFSATIIIMSGWLLFTTWLSVITDHVPFDLIKKNFIAWIPASIISGLVVSVIDGIYFEYEILKKKSNRMLSFWQKVLYIFMIVLCVGAGSRLYWPLSRAEMYFEAIWGGWIVFVLLFIFIFVLQGREKSVNFDIQTVEGLRWSWLDFVSLFTISGLLPALIQAIFFSKNSIPLIYRWIIPALLASIFVSLRFDVIKKDKTRPNHGILMSGRNAAIISIVLGAFFSIFFFIAGPVTGYFPGEPLGAVFFGLTICIFSWLWYGGLDVIKHYTLRTVLFFRDYCPWRYSRFLDQAVSLIFLRKVGGGYIFVHRLLLEYFTSLKQKR